MTDYRRIETSAEVWAVIHARHRDLRVYSSCSEPSGSHYGDPQVGRMFTAYSLQGADYPLIEAETTWTITPDEQRTDEQHKYWLCVIEREE